MSEAKRVKGWAIVLVAGWHNKWCARGDGKEWSSGKEHRHLFPSLTASQVVTNYMLYGGGGGIDCRYKILKVVAKPKAPKPDKLEQAIAKVKQRAEAHEVMELNWVTAKRWGHADASRLCKQECLDVAHLLEALR